MADTSNLSKFLSDVAEAIRTKKEITDTIPAKDFDTEILSIQTGINTYDATAGADNIEYGYTAYANGQKITGTIVTNTDAVITAGPDATITDTGNALNVDRGYGKKLILKSEQQLRSTIPYATLASVGEITADKIVKGKTIFGVAGTAEGGSSVSTTDNGLRLFTSLAEAEANENSLAPGEVAVIFDTIEYPFVLGKHREPSTRVNSYSVIPNDTTATSIFIRDAFTLPQITTCVDSVSYQSTSSGKTSTYVLEISLTETECHVTVNFSGLSANHILYSSTDGLNYIFEKMYYLNGSTENILENKVLANGLNDSALALYDLAMEKYDSFNVLNDIFYRKAPRGFKSMWFVDAADTPTLNSFYTLDMTRALNANYPNTGYYYPTRTPVDLTDILPILKSMTYSSESSSQSLVTVCITDEYYYAGTCVGLIYSREEDKLYLYGYNNDARACSRYNRNTGVKTKLSSIRTIYQSGETTPEYIYAELPKSALCVEFDGDFNSSTLTDISSYTKSGPELYVYNTTQGSNIIRETWTLIHLAGKKVITKNDFGAPFTADDLPRHTSAITNAGFINGTKSTPEISLQEETQTINILNEVIGGE